MMRTNTISLVKARIQIYQKYRIYHSYKRCLNNLKHIRTQYNHKHPSCKCLEVKLKNNHNLEVQLKKRFPLRTNKKLWYNQEKLCSE